MDKYIFWIAFIAIITFGLIVTSAVISYAWVNSPTDWSFEFGLDNESLLVINRTLYLSDYSEEAAWIEGDYDKDFRGALDEI